MSKSKSVLWCSLLLNIALLAVLGALAYQRLWLPHLSNQDALKGPANIPLTWHGNNEFDIEGQGWLNLKHRYDRLPAHAHGKVTQKVWERSEETAGLSVRFVTDAPSIHVRWTLRSKNIGGPKMAPAGSSGLDLYVRSGDQWLWAGVGLPYQFPANRARLVHNLPAGKREYLLYLPIFNGIDAIEIGVPTGASFSRAPAPPKGVKPILFYGTSITQGAVVSRPGLAYPARLGRRLGHPTINLGLSGYGEMQPEVVALIAEIDAAAYVIDCLPNMTIGQVRQMVEPLVTKLRETHEQTPILLVENATFTNPINTAQTKDNASKNAALRAAFARLQKRGVPHLYYLTGDALLGKDYEATIDGTHPTDLGFFRIAQAMEPLLREMLPRQNELPASTTD